MPPTVQLPDQAQLERAQYEWLCGFIREETGIVLTPAKQTMAQARLNRRLRRLGLASYDQYFELLESAEGCAQEIAALVDAITTNKTEFFREPKHFELLEQELLPTLLGDPRRRGNRQLRFWCAGCSTGEEPYTLSMVLHRYFTAHAGGYQILATDICQEALARAKAAVYTDEVCAPVPRLYRDRYLMRGTGRWDGHVRVVPELRQSIDFSYLNLMNPSFEVGAPLDVVFCRNVTIYFDTATKSELARKFHEVLKPGGYLIIGHSETLKGIYDGLEFVAPTVYRNACPVAR